VELDFSYLDVKNVRADFDKPASVSKPSWGPIEKRLRHLPGAPKGSKVTLTLTRAVHAFPTLFAIHDGGGKLGVMFTGDDGTLIPEQEHYPLEDVVRLFRGFFDTKTLSPDDGWMQE